MPDHIEHDSDGDGIPDHLDDDDDGDGIPDYLEVDTDGDGKIPLFSFKPFKRCFIIPFSMRMKIWCHGTQKLK